MLALVYLFFYYHLLRLEPKPEEKPKIDNLCIKLKVMNQRVSM